LSGTGRAPRLGNAPQRALGARGAIGGEVAEGDHSYQALALIDDRHAPDLPPHHGVFDFLNGIVFEAPAYLVGHHRMYRGCVWRIPCAVDRTTMCRSVMMPTSRLPSQTGRAPTSGER
jgi:hypothetical protein